MTGFAVLVAPVDRRACCGAESDASYANDGAEGCLLMGINKDPSDEDDGMNGVKRMDGMRVESSLAMVNATVAARVEVLNASL
jgi:hypothetical protein